MPLAQGQTLQNRYRIVRMLGQGGMAAVYLAQDMPQGNRWVAIKEMIPDPNAGAHALAQARTQFRREAQMLMSLRHHNLPQVYESFAVGGNEYLVMQYIEGRNLLDIAATDWQQGRILGESRVLGWAMQIMDALEYLHGQHPYPVLHRDVKPQNIILTPGGELYLVDLGLMKLLDPNNPQTMTALRGLGTPEYAPPEQYATGGAHTGPHSDVYALGATLYHLLTRQPPSTATDRLLPAPMTRPLVPPRQLNPAISLPVEQALVKALELAPAHRFTSVAEMRRALLGQGMVGPATPSPTRRMVPRGLAIGIGAISLLVIAIVILVAVLGGGGGVTTAMPTHTAIAQATPTLAPPTVMRVPPTDTPNPTYTPTATPKPTHTPTSTPTPAPPIETPVPSIPSGMVYVPAGEFTMGSNVESSDEQPVHTVYLNAFWIDKTEVTNVQFAQFLNEQGNQEESGATWLEIEDENCLITQIGEQYQPKSGYSDHPVIEVSWYGARAYCRWAGKRLPTEAEWEKAARGADGLIYPWGNTFDGTKVNFADKNISFDWSDSNWDDGYAGTAPVGSYLDGASPYRALDMAGNVWEWVADWYDSVYYTFSPESNPKGPASGDYRVVRGGSWFSDRTSMRAADRYADYPDGRNFDVGFRCARGSE